MISYLREELQSQVSKCPGRTHLKLSENGKLIW